MLHASANSIMFNSVLVGSKRGSSVVKSCTDVAEHLGSVPSTNT